MNFNVGKIIIDDVMENISIERNQVGGCEGKMLEKKVYEKGNGLVENICEAQLIGVFAEEFHKSSLFNELMRYK